VNTVLTDREAAPADPHVRTVRTRSTNAVMAIVFTSASFTSAFLLFLVQPMVARLVLPSYGGSAAVWNTAMVFFQGALLVGYLYAHVLSGRRRVPTQTRVHLVVLGLAALTLPITLPTWAPPPSGRSPALWLLVVLVVLVGAPFVALSTTGPLLQRWFSLTDHPHAADPYFLFAASNAGSFLALVSYPTLVEPRLSVTSQTRLWGFGYGAFVALVVAAIVVGRLRTVQGPGQSAPLLDRAVGLRSWARWVGFAFIPSSLMLGVTSYITTDLAAVPLLWVIPLALYLATFVIAFGARRRPEHRGSAAAAIGLAAVTAAILGRSLHAPVALQIGGSLALFTLVALASHRRLADSRPAAEHLTTFYLAVATGGVLGGIANALVAPVVFNRVLEYPVVLAAALPVLLRAPIRPTPIGRRYGRPGRALEPLLLLPFLLVLVVLPFDNADLGRLLYLPAFALAVAIVATRWRGIAAWSTAMLLVVVAVHPVPYSIASRTFFGVYRVFEQSDQMVLEHGSTIHGQEWLDPARRDEPIGYYSRTSPIGQLLSSGRSLDDVAVVGLGVGTLAAYGRPGRHMTFYEIDPEMVRIARDSGRFHYLEDSASSIDYVVGDGRLELGAAPASAYDLIVLDAFSSDAIPVHLITQDAIREYLGHLAPGGVLAFHISNNHVDLAPVLAGAAADLGLTARLRADDGGATPGALPSEWVVLAKSPGDLGSIEGDPRWHDLASHRHLTWTDDYSNLLSVLH
jgi:SAM-dependent methyltransferase